MRELMTSPHKSRRNVLQCSVPGATMGLAGLGIIPRRDASVAWADRLPDARERGLEPGTLHYSSVRSANGLNLAVAEWGNPEGKPVLLLHGLSVSTHIWKHQHDAAKTARYRIVAFDLRGHGASDKPSSPQNYNRTKAWADDVAAVISAKQLFKPVVVAGSFGGNVAINYVRHHG